MPFGCFSGKIGFCALRITLHATCLPNPELLWTPGLTSRPNSGSLANILHLTRAGLRGTVAEVARLMLAVPYFATTFLGQKMKLKLQCKKRLIISRRFFGVPPFRFYALADAIRHVLSHSPPPASPPPPDQWPLQLFLAWHG